MLKRTGPGIIFARRRDPNDSKFFKRGYVSVFLGNFDIDGDSLKKEHTDWLDGRLIPALQNRMTDLLIEGFASKSGRARHNKRLSKRRANSLLVYLKSKKIGGVTFNEPFGLGEERATTWEGKRDRAVCINILDDCFPTPGPCKDPDPPPVPPKKELFRMPVREVYMSYFAQEKDVSGPMGGKIKYQFFPWKLIRADLSYAPKNAKKRMVLLTDRAGIRREYKNFGMRVMGMAVFASYKVIDYYYLPPAEPKSKRKFRLPESAEDVLNLYSSGREKKPPR